MYTLVFKWKDDTMVVFDVYHTKRGKQRIIGNIFCRKEDDGRYKANSIMTLTSIVPPNKPGHMRKIPLEQLKDNAEYICNLKWFDK